MTTIATDGKTMAADTMQLGAYVDQIKRVKVIKLPDGRVVGCAGACDNQELFTHWLSNGGDKPTIRNGFEALVIDNGLVFYYCESLEPVQVGVPASVGSGEKFAMGAMMAGCSPLEAVEIAIKLDTQSGGDVIVVETKIGGN